jgi:transcriptional regulator CtsR
MKISDSIANYILELLESSGSTEIRRNELANTLGCVPSQINYVLTSRFTPEQGYRIESQRGGGGYIRITRVYHDPESALTHIIHSIGDRVDSTTVRAIFVHLCKAGTVDQRTSRVMAAAVSDQSFVAVPQEERDKLRATVLKNMLIALL